MCHRKESNLACWSCYVPRPLMAFIRPCSDVISARYANDVFLAAGNKQHFARLYYYIICARYVV